MPNPLRIIYPYAGERHPLTIAGAPPEAEWFDVSADPHAYWRLMCAAWDDALASGCGLVFIEHDVVCRPDIIETFATCPEPWCVYPYNTICHWGCQEAWANSLGCTRFSYELIAACPDAVSSIPEDMRGWQNLCDHIAGDKVHGTPAPLRPSSVRAAGFAHHWHFPHVGHHHMGRNGPELEMLAIVGPTPDNENPY